LLSFREIPAILAALATLSTTPDLFMVDGHGIAHPRRMGIAAHLGVHLDMPSIGVAKSRLTGKFDMPGNLKGDKSPLMAGEEQNRNSAAQPRQCKPSVFISPGHSVAMDMACDIVQKNA
jgi:deoxyribonuclease V